MFENIRVATYEDLSSIKIMARKFVVATNYAPYVDEVKMDLIIESFLNSPMDRVTIIYPDKGMILGMVTPFMFGHDSIATEMAWWVEPEERGNKVGKELILGFEEWAKVMQCKLITLASLDDKVGKFYEKHGYKLYERAYVKEL